MMKTAKVNADETTIEAELNKLTPRLLKKQLRGLAVVMAGSAAGQIMTMRGYEITWKTSQGEIEIEVYW